MLRYEELGNEVELFTLRRTRKLYDYAKSFGYKETGYTNLFEKPHGFYTTYYITNFNYNIKKGRPW